MRLRQVLLGTIAKVLELFYTSICKLSNSEETYVANRILFSISGFLESYSIGQYRITCQIGENTLIVRPFILSDLSLYIGHDEKEPYVQSAFKPKKGDTVIDAGAHIGFYTIKAARDIGNEGRVIAVEPDFESYELLKANVKINKLTNVKSFNAALCNSDGERTFYSCKDPVLSGFYYEDQNMERVKAVQKVKTIKLDSILHALKVSSVNWIKIDVEGAELELLQGATQTLAQKEDIQIIVETANKEVINFLKNQNFKIKRLSDIYYHAYKK